MASLFFANDGGSSTMVSNRRPSSTASRRKSKALAVTTSTFWNPLRCALCRSASHAGSEISTAVTFVARVRQLQREPADVGEAVQRLAAGVGRGEQWFSR